MPIIETKETDYSMANDIKNMSRKELEKLKAQVEKQLEKLDKADRKAALEAVKQAAKAHGYSLNELTGGGSASAASKSGGKPRKARANGTVNPPRYRNPDNPDQTWTGKGRRPEWIKAAQSKGVDIETMAI